ncbi:precorrin-6y C5,15-methyltransferase (decarboxylating) subunit CbiE [Rhodococcus sp. G-MC3]|uniref:precorrin-6y C5,15-methyltransferase (decarboxylating) subunit CbiE n=1 Tax=Rhodococcus sp. G-MC3 TaxID=3046209 RepID=UPI0024BAF580|nr:precorrin-6y C5,15-methyltransferase (decarboxylating) subunit CbiE [Rhodococcus sp. G-MC3]MDJ0394995.1 precorrin-6y C5,15-methyltransferase (decarboxylating) subunit CbiE [Rhodococcus sp. G-MC3]
MANDRLIDVVGIGADGWEGLSESVRAVVSEADVVFGSTRQLASIPVPRERQRTWPSPLLPALRSSIDEFEGSRICVLASGDPMFYGIGVSLVREFGASQLRVIPAPSSLSLACARLGWAVHGVTTVNLVNAAVSVLLPALSDGVKVLALSRDHETPVAVATLLRDSGFGASHMRVLEQLGGPTEHIVAGTAAEWTAPAGDRLNVIAIECIADPSRTRLTRMPGLPDSAYDGDGQLTKNEVRSLTLSALAPSPGESLWDVGGGSGSIAIEWMRTDPTCRATIFESVPRRRAHITANASALGVPGLDVRGAAPGAFENLGSPNAVFIGGGVTQVGMVDTCWSHLPDGGRLVANAVTAESEALLLHYFSRYGGSLRKFQIYRGEPLGAFTSWRPQLPIAQWVCTKS